MCEYTILYSKNLNTETRIATAAATATAAEEGKKGKKKNAPLNRGKNKKKHRRLVTPVRNKNQPLCARLVLVKLTQRTKESERGRESEIGEPVRDKTSLWHNVFVYVKNCS